MAGPALADALIDFGARPRRAPAPCEPSMPAAPIAPAIDYEAMLAREVAEAEARLADRLAGEHRAEMAALAENHGSAIDALQAEIGRQAAAAIAERFDALGAEIAASTAATAARILGQVVTEDLQKRAVDALGEAIARAIDDGEALRIRVRGAPALCEAVREKLGARADQVDFAPGDGFDLSVSLDDAVLETRLAEWSAALGEVLA